MGSTRLTALPHPRLLPPPDKKQPQHCSHLSVPALTRPWCPEPSLLLSQACLAGFLSGFGFVFVFWSIVAYNVVLVSALQKSESAIHIHISPRFWISFPFRSPLSTE